MVHKMSTMRMVCAFVRIFFVAFALLDANYVHSWRVGSVGRLLTVNRSVKSLALHGRKPKVQASAPAVIVSPFDPSQGKGAEGEGINTTAEPKISLTWANVETVLNDVRPYLQSDGGDVELVGIDGGVIKLQLVGACGTCASSQMTMKMGIERRLRERITGVEEVVQQQPKAPPLTKEALEGVLDNVRPFLGIAGGRIEVVRVGDEWSHMQPSVALRMEGSAAALQAVKVEIVERIQKHFKAPVRVDWIKPEPQW